MALESILENKAVVSCRKESSVEEMARLMDEHDVGALVIIEHDKPIGMVTDRDIVLRCLAKGSDVKVCKAQDVMTTPVQTISSKAGIYELIDRMEERQIRRICVVDENERCLGIVSLGDLMELMARELGKIAAAAAPVQQKIIQEQKSA